MLTAQQRCFCTRSLQVDKHRCRLALVGGDRQAVIIHFITLRLEESWLLYDLAGTSRGLHVIQRAHRVRLIPYLN